MSVGWGARGRGISSVRRVTRSEGKRRIIIWISWALRSLTGSPEVRITGRCRELLWTTGAKPSSRGKMLAGVRRMRGVDRDVFSAGFAEFAEFAKVEVTRIRVRGGLRGISSVVSVWFSVLSVAGDCSGAIDVPLSVTVTLGLLLLFLLRDVPFSGESTGGGGGGEGGGVRMLSRDGSGVESL